MTSRDFCYWLRGYFEVSKPEHIPGEALGLIRKHLDLVFEHEIDPSAGTKEHQVKLNKVHGDTKIRC